MTKHSILRATLLALCLAATVSGPADAQRSVFRNHANSAVVAQSGNGNAAGVLQNGSGNDAALAQSGNNNSGVVAQTGDNNGACLYQHGHNLSGSITQVGNGQSVALVQSSTGWHPVSMEVCRAQANGGVRVRDIYRNTNMGVRPGR